MRMGNPLILLIMTTPINNNAGEVIDTIGTAEMKSDGSIVLKLRGESADGSVGDFMNVYEVGSEGYSDIVNHLGGLEPNQTKMVPPWPE